MALIGAIITCAFLGVLMLAVYAKTMTDDNNRLRRQAKRAALVLECILDPDDVVEYEGEGGAATLAKDKIDLLNALRDPDGKAAAEL